MTKPRARGLPSWLRTVAPEARNYRATATALDELHVNTICRQARCPNTAECFSTHTASFLILGPMCTRSCRFCAVGTHASGGLGATAEAQGSPSFETDDDEPQRVAAAVVRLGLRHVVVTSVTRDDLPDGGAGSFARTITAIRAAAPGSSIEVLVPDFEGNEDRLGLVLAARPDVFAHNLETLARLSPLVRPQGDYRRSLALLKAAVHRARPPHERRAHDERERPPFTVKTGFMVGLGERDEEVLRTLEECAAVGIDTVTIGQYLRPDDRCLPVVRFVDPAVFAGYETYGESLGLLVHAGPLVRSSYRAESLVQPISGRKAAIPRCVPSSEPGEVAVQSGSADTFIP